MLFTSVVSCTRPFLGFFVYRKTDLDPWQSSLGCLDDYLQQELLPAFKLSGLIELAKNSPELAAVAERRKISRKAAKVVQKTIKKQSEQDRNGRGHLVKKNLATSRSDSTSTV